MGRPQRLAIDAVMALVHDLDMVKSRNLTSPALFLDVQGAFDNVSSDRLLHTLHHLGCPTPIISWSASFLTSRSTALSFNGRTDQQHPITTGIPQGSLVSPIIFLLYLHPLFDTLRDSHPGLWCPIYIDDVALVVHGPSREDNARSLEAAVVMAFYWLEESAVAFDDAKLELLHLFIYLFIYLFIH
jgi:hypothetical protein